MADRCGRRGIAAQGLLEGSGGLGASTVLQLTDEQRRRFAEDGFLILDRFVEPEQVARVVERFEPLFRGQFETGLYPDEWNWREERDPADRSRQICNGWK